VCLVGRPNTGKSTLTNALVGRKIVITSSRPQTTRHVVRGIVHRPDAQLVLLDTPGLHRPRTLLGERLNDLVRGTWAEADLVGVCLPANEKVGPGDRFLVTELARVRPTEKLAIVTKSDLVSADRMAEHLSAIASLGEAAGLEWAEIVPVSAVAGTQVALLADLLVEHSPEGPAMFPAGELSDEPEQTLVAELIREAALEGVREELPHSIAVVVEEMAPRADRPQIDRCSTCSPTSTSNGPARRGSCWAPRVTGSRASAPGPARRSRRCWARRSSSTCTSRWRRTGSATPSSCASWASDCGS
jgi:GTP-binding protein Era